MAGGLLDVLRNAKDKSERMTVLDALNRLAQDDGQYCKALSSLAKPCPSPVSERMS